MNRDLALELANKVKALLAEHPELTYGMIIYDDENVVIGANSCLRCVSGKFEAFLDENDVKHDADVDEVQDDLSDEAIH